MYDTIIIGAGPAAMTAAIYAARREMKALIVGKELGGQIMWASEIENYPGFKSIDNFDLVSRLQEQVSALGVEIKSALVTSIKSKENIFELRMDDQKLETRTVIIATGLTPRKLEIKGEPEYLGKGVSYCANCDGPFYKGKDVAVVGGGNSALDAAEVMSKIARKVYLVHRRQEFRAFEAAVDKVKAQDNIELVLDSEVVEIQGSEKVEKIQIRDKNNQATREIKVDGVFIEVGRMPQSDWLAGVVDLDEGGQVKVDKECSTNIPGVFAAGDCTDVPFKQITVAAGQGTIAALSAYKFLQNQ